MKPRTQKEIDDWNAGARQADAHWADTPRPSSIPGALSESAPDGRSIGSAYPKGHFIKQSKDSK